MTLDQYLSSWKPLSFDWAAANCLHFAAGWVRECSGVDPMRGVPSFTSPRLWVRWVRGEGGLEQAVRQRLHWQPRHPAFVQRNDIILTKGMSTGWAFGICAGRLIACLDDRGQVAMVDVPIEAAWAHERDQ